MDPQQKQRIQISVLAFNATLIFVALALWFVGYPAGSGSAGVLGNLFIDFGIRLLIGGGAGVIVGGGVYFLTGLKK